MALAQMPRLQRAALSRGSIHIDQLDGQRITLTKKADGSRVVSSLERNGRTERPKM
jgi:hypothetical protein